MQNSIVIDLGYGDSGKGLTVDWLASTYNYSTVVRYSGGSQCGHGVRHGNSSEEGLFHEFQTWGAGTLRNINTFLAKDVVFDPISVVKEHDLIKGKLPPNYGLPRMYIHPHCPVITPYDVHSGRNDNKILEHGSCGRGIFPTKKREMNHHHIHAIDLIYPTVLKAKMEELRKYYQFPRKDESGDIVDIDLSEFYDSVKTIRQSSNYVIKDAMNDIMHDGMIFESSQGLLLDERIGIFPHCTPSKLDIPEEYDFSDIYIVTRAYHSRHGNGPLSTESYPIEISKWETNYNNAYQGTFRTGVLDVDMLCYSLRSSNIIPYLVNHPEAKLNLIITHLDVVKDDWRLMINENIQKFDSMHEFTRQIVNYVNIGLRQYNRSIHKYYGNATPFAGNIFEVGELSNQAKDSIPIRTRRSRGHINIVEEPMGIPINEDINMSMYRPVEVSDGTTNEASV